MASRCAASRRTRKEPYVSPRLARFVAGSGADLVHCQGFHTLVSPLAMLAAIARDLPFVMTVHTGGHSSRARTLARPLQAALLGPLVRRARAVIAVSRWEADHMGPRLGLPAERLGVIANGADLPAVAAGVQPEPGLIVSPGRLERYKGHHRVIDAVPAVLRHRPDAHLRILGGGPDEAALRLHAARLGLQDRIEIRAERDREAMAATLARAQAVVSLSEYRIARASGPRGPVARPPDGRDRRERAGRARRGRAGPWRPPGRVGHRRRDSRGHGGAPVRDAC